MKPSDEIYGVTYMASEYGWATVGFFSTWERAGTWIEKQKNPEMYKIDIIELDKDGNY